MMQMQPSFILIGPMLAGVGYMIGRPGLRALIRWRWRRMLEKLIDDNPISEAAKEVAYFDAVESGMIKKAKECRKCWQGTIEHVRNQVAAPPIYDMCRNCKEDERRRYLGGGRTTADDDHKYWRKKFEEASVVLESLKPQTGLTSSKNGHLVTGYEDDFKQQSSPYKCEVCHDTGAELAPSDGTVIDTMPCTRC